MKINYYYYNNNYNNKNNDNNNDNNNNNNNKIKQNPNPTSCNKLSNKRDVPVVPIREMIYYYYYYYLCSN